VRADHNIQLLMILAPPTAAHLAQVAVFDHGAPDACLASRTQLEWHRALRSSGPEDRSATYHAAAGNGSLSSLGFTRSG